MSLLGGSKTIKKSFYMFTNKMASLRKSCLIIKNRAFTDR